MIDEEEEAIAELLSQSVKMRLKSWDREDELNASTFVRLSINGLELPFYLWTAQTKTQFLSSLDINRYDVLKKKVLIRYFFNPTWTALELSISSF